MLALPGAAASLARVALPDSKNLPRRERRVDRPYGRQCGVPTIEEVSSMVGAGGVVFPRLVHAHLGADRGERAVAALLGDGPVRPGSAGNGANVGSNT